MLYNRLPRCHPPAVLRLGESIGDTTKGRCEVKRVKSGADGLPAKFTEEERDCYQWLYDCGIKGWLVDLLDKSVRWVDASDRMHTSKSLVEFAKLRGRRKGGAK